MADQDSGYRSFERRREILVSGRYRQWLSHSQTTYECGQARPGRLNPISRARIFNVFAEIPRQLLQGKWTG